MQWIEFIHQYEKLIFYEDVICMGFKWSSQATILITGGEHVGALYHVKGDMDTMLEALMPVRESYTAGTYHIVSSDFISGDCIPTSDYAMSGEEKIKETSTESGKKISLEEIVVDFVMTIMPEIEYILTKKQLDSIKDSSKKIGAVNVYLDSIGENVDKLSKSLDMQLENLEMIQSRLWFDVFDISLVVSYAWLWCGTRCCSRKTQNPW